MAARPCIRCGKPNWGWRRHDFCASCRRPEYSIDCVYGLAGTFNDQGNRHHPPIRIVQPMSSVGDHAEMLRKRKNTGPYREKGGRHN